MGTSQAKPTAYIRLQIADSRPKASKGYYAVAKGRKPGIYGTWAECEAQVKGFPACVSRPASSG